MCVKSKPTSNCVCVKSESKSKFGFDPGAAPACSINKDEIIYYNTSVSLYYTILHYWNVLTWSILTIMIFVFSSALTSINSIPVMLSSLSYLIFLKIVQDQIYTKKWIMQLALKFLLLLTFSIILFSFWQFKDSVGILRFAFLQTLTELSRHRPGSYAVDLQNNTMQEIIWSF